MPYAAAGPPVDDAGLVKPFLLWTRERLVALADVLAARPEDKKALLADSPALIFLCLVTLILIVPPICRRFKIPDIVGLILVGIAIGPHALYLIPAKADSLTGMLGYAGLLFILFLSGMETDLHQFLRSRRRSLVFGALSYIIPQFGMMALAMPILGMDFLTALLLGSMCASHTLLTYPQASRLGLGRYEPVTVSVGATMIVNLVALLVLAGVAQWVTGEATGLWGKLARIFPPANHLAAQMALGIPLAGLVFFKLVPSAARRFLSVTPENGNAPFLFVLAVVFFSAWVADMVGLQGIIGAFAVGLSLNRLIPEQSVLMNRIGFISETLFVPAFLLTVGMMVDLSSVFGAAGGWQATCGTALVITGGLVACKWLAARLAAKYLGYTASDGGLMFGLTVVQAAGTLAAVMVGMRLGLFDQAVLNGAIAVILVSCVLGARATERYGREAAARLAETVVPPEERPDQRIVVPLANPATVARLLDFAFLLRDRRRRGTLLPLMVARDDGQPDRSVANCERLLGLAVSHATAADQAVTPLVRIDVNVADGIVRAVTEARGTDVLLGWTGAPRARSFFFGELADQLIEACPARLHVTRLVRPPALAKRLVWAIPPLTEIADDFPAGARMAKRFAHQAGVAEVLVLSAGGERTRLAANLKEMEPQLAMRFVPANSLAELWRVLDEQLRPDDTMILAVARSGPGVWPRLREHMPRQLAARHPGHNLMISYTALPAGEGGDVEDTLRAEEDGAAATTTTTVAPAPDAGDGAAPASPSPSVPSSPSARAGGGVVATPAPALATHRLSRLLVKADGLLRLPGADLNSILLRAVTAALPDELVGAARTLRALREVARSYPAQLLPGVVLLHARAPRIRRTALVIATTDTPIVFSDDPALPGGRRDGWHIHDPVRVVLCLLRPEAARDERERHLAVLSSLGRSFRRPDVVEKLLAARTTAEAGAILDGESG